jgi:seryl-tRNA synthetase
MVTTEVAQLSQECNAWRETLRSYRDEFGKLKQHLQKIAPHQSHKEDLLQLEHLDNQLHIQLINIHDLKQAIKNHDRKIHQELANNNGKVSDETLADHENLLDEYKSLESTLKEIKEEFNEFATART